MMRCVSSFVKVSQQHSLLRFFRSDKKEKGVALFVAFLFLHFFRPQGATVDAGRVPVLKRMSLMPAASRESDRSSADRCPMGPPE